MSEKSQSVFSNRVKSWSESDGEKSSVLSLNRDRQSRLEHQLEERTWCCHSGTGGSEIVDGWQRRGWELQS